MATFRLSTSFGIAALLLFVVFSSATAKSARHLTYIEDEEAVVKGGPYGRDEFAHYYATATVSGTGHGDKTMNEEEEEETPKTQTMGPFDSKTFKPYSVNLHSKEECEEAVKVHAVFVAENTWKCWTYEVDEEKKKSKKAKGGEKRVVKCAPDGISEKECNNLDCVFARKTEGDCWELEG